MDNTQYQPYMRDNYKPQEMNNDIQDAIFIELDQIPPPPPPPPPSSSSSSPTHEFSFTVSLQPQPPKINNQDKTFAIDLSPADDIFFHGHLLPLHLLSHLPVSPRSSTNSLDSFTLPIKELLPAYNQNHDHNVTHSSNDFHHQNKDSEKGGRIKSKSFSIFGLPTKWRKGCEEGERDSDYPYKKKQRFDISHVLKRYARMVKPLLSFRGSSNKRSNMEFPRQPYSYSGSILSARGKAEFRRRRGELSAPASMRTSPTNSGILLATSGTVSPTKSSTESTMEELQAAIQAAIAHCKNSIAVQDKIQCQED